MLKKMIGLILAAAMLLACVGCSSGTQTPAPETKEEPKTQAPAEAPAAPAEEIVLDFPSWQATEAGFAEFWADVIGRFEADHPNVKINLYQVPFSGYVDTMITRFSGGNPPDIVHIPAANFYTFYREGWLENLDGRFAQTDINETWTPLQSAVQGDDGSNYGLLLMGYGQILYYNEKLLNEEGIAVPTNMEEFLDAARKLTKDTDNDGVVDQFGYATCTATSASLMSCLGPFIAGNETEWATGQKINVDDPKVAEGLNTFKALYTENLMPLGVTIEQSRTYFLDGKAAMYMDGSYFYASLGNAAEGVAEHLKVAPTPTRNVVGSPSNSVHMAASLDEARKELVWEFYKLMASDEYQTKYAEYTKNPPPKSTALTDELIAKQPTMELFAVQASQAKDIRPAAYIPYYTEFSNIVVDEVLAFCTDGAMTAEECLDRIQEAVEMDIYFE